MQKNQITESIYEDENSMMDELQEPKLNTKLKNVRENEKNDEYSESSYSDDSENSTKS